MPQNTRQIFDIVDNRTISNYVERFRTILSDTAREKGNLFRLVSLRLSALSVYVPFKVSFSFFLVVFWFLPGRVFLLCFSYPVR